MPKRTFWLVTGAAIGAGSSLWAERKVRRSVQEAAARLQPDAIVVEVGRTARQAAGTAGSRVRDALSSGRDEMQRREEELWADLAAQGVATDPGVPAAVVASEPPPTPVDPPDERSRPSRPFRPARPTRRRKRPPAKSPSHLAK